MSLSILSQPSLPLLSAGNDNTTTLSGTTNSINGIQDYKYIADVYVNGVKKVTLKSYPDPLYGFGVFNTRNIISPFIGYDYFPTDPSPMQIFRLCPNSSARVYILFGEEYMSGSTFVQTRNILTGSTANYINASIPLIPNITLSGLTSYFAFDTPTAANSYLSDVVITSHGVHPYTTNTYSNLRSFLYCANSLMNNTPNAICITTLNITTRNALNVGVGSYQIVSPYTYPYSSATDVMAVAVGYGQLSLLTSGQTTIMTGGWPMFGPTVASYTVNVDAPPPSSALTSASQWQTPVYAIQCDGGRFATGAYTISWLNSVGGFDSWLFNKKNVTTQNKTQSTYKKVSGTLSSNGKYTNNTFDTSQIPYYTTVQDSIVMTTDFLADTEVLLLKSLFSSPVIFMTDQNNVTTNITIQDNAYTINKIVNTKSYTLSMTVNQSVQNYRQQL